MAQSSGGIKIIIIKLQKTFSSSPSATVLSCRPRAYKNDVCLFLKELVERVPRLYLPALTMELKVEAIHE